jgi:hypothetical protein
MLDRVGRPAASTDDVRKSSDVAIVMPHAGLAQLVEHLICNHEVVSSILTPGSNKNPGSRAMAFNVAE